MREFPLAGVAAAALGLTRGSGFRVAKRKRPNAATMTIQNPALLRIWELKRRRVREYSRRSTPVCKGCYELSGLAMTERGVMPKGWEFEGDLRKSLSIAGLAVLGAGGCAAPCGTAIAASSIERQAQRRHPMNPQTLWIFVAALVAVIVVGALVALAVNRRRRESLRTRFGSEYDRTVEATGSRSSAERELAQREKEVSKLDIRPLTASDRDGFRHEWDRI